MHLVSLSRRGLAWIIGLTASHALASPEHPLCRALENDGQVQPLGRYPATYVCHHPEQNEDVVCSKLDIGADDTPVHSRVGSEVVGAAPAGSRPSPIVGTVRLIVQGSQPIFQY